MTRNAVLVALLCCWTCCFAVQARSIRPAGGSRQLLQATVNIRCPAGCADGACVADSTTGGYSCIRCLNDLVVNIDDGTCGCPAGRYASGTGAAATCLDCPKGSWCAGGQFDGAAAPNRTDCGSDLTTIGQRSTNLRACVNVAGTYYSIDGSGNPSATPCPVNTYCSGLRKQRSCTPCPSGYVTNNVTRARSAAACVVPEGYYLKGPGQVAPCPQGEYKSGFSAAPSCTRCANGVSTPSEASISESNCTVLLPGVYSADIQSGIIKSTAKCPQKYYCPGGSPTAKFDVSQTTPNTTGTTVVLCANGAWTQGIGSSSPDQCMTPPGHYTTGGQTLECIDGEYRTEWKPPGAAGSCNKCGAGISSSAVDQLITYAITPDATQGTMDVRASTMSCYIKAGQGMYYSTISKGFRGVDCVTNSYGLANTTYGLSAFPCRGCPQGMQTSVSLPNSAAYHAANGFTSPMACVTKAGYGYNGRNANPCVPGSYNAEGNYATCTDCPPGLSTVNDPTQQTNISACVTAIGYGFHDGALVPCPVGFYNDALGPNATAPCTSCPAGSTTMAAGGRSLSDCNLCTPGFGGLGCNGTCGGVSPTYGPPGRAADSNCTNCPNITTGFSFFYQLTNDAYAPATVARSGADSIADCLAEFAQINDAQWYMDGNTTLAGSSSADTFDACITSCKGDPLCQYVTFDYDAASGSRCKWRQRITGATGEVLAVKAVVVGDSTGTNTNSITTASSVRTSASSVRPTSSGVGSSVSSARAASSGMRTAVTRLYSVQAAPSSTQPLAAAAVNSTTLKAKGLGSGSYTFWKDAATGVGAFVVDQGAQDSVATCLAICDSDFDCAAVSMTNVTTSTSAPATCKLIKGNNTIALWKRSMTRTVVAQLMVETAV